MTNDALYERREQTAVKHDILQHYLERFAHIVGFKWDSITYVDGFAGPWNARSTEFKDSSFAIALTELRRAQATHSERGKRLRLRCLFLEEDREAHRQLQRFAEGIKDAEVKVLNASFEQSVTSIIEFVHAGGPGTFPFLFIDPTGWTGFSSRLISPLLRLDPGEVLVNFMTSHIRRFSADEGSRKSLEELFGSADALDRLAGLSGQDLDDALVAEYSSTLRKQGRFPYVHSAIVLHPEKARTHFHLIYATRHPRGVEVFKETEKRAMPKMEKLRAEAQQRKREERTGQGELFSTTEVTPESPHYVQLRERYLGKAKLEVVELLRQLKRVSYDQTWALALRWPLVWESDLKDWIKNTPSIRVEGLKPRERVPALGESHFLVWLDGTP